MTIDERLQRLAADNHPGVIGELVSVLQAMRAEQVEEQRRQLERAKRATWFAAWNRELRRGG